MATIHTLRLRLSNAYLVIGERPVLIDAGSPGEADRIALAMKKHGVEPADIALILLTHAHTDHAGSAQELRERTGAPVAIHAADAGMLRRGTMGPLQPLRPRHKLLDLYVNRPFDGFEADQRLVENQRLDAFGLPGRIVVTPGHTSGSVSVVLDPADERGFHDAVIGDLLIGGFLGGLLDRRRSRLPYFAEDYQVLQQSLAKLLATAGGVLYPGHGGPLNALKTGKWHERQAAGTLSPATAAT